MGRRPGGTTVDTKEQLLAAAARVIAARGYEGARVSEIAAEAGLSTGAI
ncbi:MAG: TetR family transcriptional regulator, partial [Acidimicrobiia bacterium]